MPECRTTRVHSGKIKNCGHRLSLDFSFALRISEVEGARGPRRVISVVRMEEKHRNRDKRAEDGSTEDRRTKDAAEHGM